MADLTRKTANLIDYSFFTSTRYITVTPITNGINLTGIFYAEINGINLDVGTTYYMSWNAEIISGDVNTLWRVQYTDNTYSINTQSGDALIIEKEVAKILFYINFSNTQTSVNITNLMLNAGSTPLPYEPYGWVHSLRKLTTATEAVENPLYSDGTAITSYTIKGNTVQDGTPTPSNPVPVVGVGELETTGEHTGEYKIPISNGQASAVNYLGSVQTTRQIKKLVLDGTENWRRNDTNSVYYYPFTGMLFTEGLVTTLSTHYKAMQNVTSYAQMEDKSVCMRAVGTSDALWIKDESVVSVDDFKSYLAQQYAAGTPVTVWYVLATEETATVNEPLMKIGDYADSISNATAIPTTEGANSITVDTTVQPSEFTATWTGWHDSSVKEYDGSDWQ